MRPQSTRPSHKSFYEARHTHEDELPQSPNDPCEKAQWKRLPAVL